jgi:SAM-dependent methyltransferase
VQKTRYDAIEEIENQLIAEPSPYASTSNKLNANDRRFHDWYRFVLSFPAHLVRTYLEEFGKPTNQNVVLDPFCGTGTTLVEAKLLGYQSVGIEANPFAKFVSSTKLNWNFSADDLIKCSNTIASKVRQQFLSEGIDDDEISNANGSNHRLKTLTSDQLKLIQANSISPLPLHKIISLLEKINEHKPLAFYDHLLLALAKTLVFRVSNLKFGPEVGLGKIRLNAPVLDPWLSEINSIASDVESVQNQENVKSITHYGDSRYINQFLKPQSIDMVITSPPYPNEKDYTRTTRLESVILGFIKSKDELRKFKKNLVRSNTRGVYKEDNDQQWISHIAKIADIAKKIEKRRIELNKTSGFERLYARVAQLYFGGMAKHLIELQAVLKPGARLAYVVGDQASYLRVMIRTGQILAEIADNLGYHVDRIDLFRTRFATATGEQLREEVLILTWPGPKI